MARVTKPHNYKSYTSGYDTGFKPSVMDGLKHPPLTRRTPKLSDMPAGRTVVVDPKRHEDFVSFDDTVRPWLKEMNLRIRTVQMVAHEGKQIMAVVLRSRRQAALFKLAWG